MGIHDKEFMRPYANHDKSGTDTYDDKVKFTLKHSVISFLSFDLGSMIEKKRRFFIIINNYMILIC